MLVQLVWQLPGKVTPTEHTTPESYDLQRYFKDMVDAGCEYMVMEVSSQGIKMDRVAGMHFNYGIFTNITPTTLDQMSMQILMSICTARAVCLRCVTSEL